MEELPSDQIPPDQLAKTDLEYFMKKHDFKSDKLIPSDKLGKVLKIQNFITYFS